MVELTKISLFKGFDHEELARVRGRIFERIYPKGTTIFVEGQKTDGLYIITSGLMKVLKLHKDGREKTLAILNEGEILGEMTLLGSDLRSATVETLQQTSVLVISKEDFQPLLLEVPKLSIRLIEVLSGRLKQANQQIQELIFLNSRCRVICNLLNLAEKYGRSEKGGIRISLHLTHAELAKLAGVSRETVTKVLAELQDSNLISISSRQLRVLNLDELYGEVM